MGRRTDLPAAIVDFGGGTKVWVFGDRASYGISTVEMQVQGFLGPLNCMRPEDADRLGDALKLAARMARGDEVPTALDQFMQQRRPA